MATEELANRLKECESIDAFLQEHRGFFDERAFQDYLERLMAGRGLNASRLADLSGVSTPYVCNLRGGSRSAPRKDMLLKLAFAMRLGVDEANRLLALGGSAPLYPKIRRESIAIYCLNRGLPIERADEICEGYGLEGFSV